MKKYFDSRTEFVIDSIESISGEDRKFLDAGFLGSEIMEAKLHFEILKCLKNQTYHKIIRIFWYKVI